MPLLFWIKSIASFRKRDITFEGDEKFWEVFIRESLNQLISKEAGSSKSPLSNAEKISIREKEVDRLLKYDENKLFEKVSNIKMSQVETFEME